MNVRNVPKPSVVLPSFGTYEDSCRKDKLRMQWECGKTLAVLHPSQNTKEFTVEISLMNVRSVGKPLAVPPHFQTQKTTVEISHKECKEVGRLSVPLLTLSYI